MIRKELEADIQSVVNRLDEKDPAERAAKSVLTALLGATAVNQEVALMDHIAVFSKRLLRAVAKSMAGRN